MASFANNKGENSTPKAKKGCACQHHGALILARLILKMGRGSPSLGGLY